MLPKGAARGARGWEPERRGLHLCISVSCRTAADGRPSPGPSSAQPAAALPVSPHSQCVVGLDLRAVWAPPGWVGRDPGRGGPGLGVTGCTGTSSPASGEEVRAVAGFSSRSASTPASRTRWWKNVGAPSTASPSLQEPATATTSSTPTGVSETTRPGTPREPAQPGPGLPVWLPAWGGVGSWQRCCPLM